jgi:diketogulonate reductase-like aldo/keto reductase
VAPTGSPVTAGSAPPGAGARAVTDHDWKVIDALSSVAIEVGRSMAQVAINWVVTQPGVAAAVIGASSVEQLDGNLAALDFELPADARRRLDEAGAPQLAPPYAMFTPQYQSWIVSPGLGIGIGDKPAGYAPPVLNALGALGA